MAQTYIIKEKEAVVPNARIAFITSLIIVIILSVAVFLSFSQIAPPAEVQAGASASEFSASRAAQHIELIAQEPHAVGSPGHERVKDYLLSQLSTLGLNPQVQKSSVLNPPGNHSLSGASVENILGRIEGTTNNKSVLLVAHYDSVPTSFGASDDGAGVATLLETARALKASPSLKNGIIFLFTDAEELGLLGAKAFTDDDTLVRDVGVVLNFDTRGNAGPSIMFETSGGNGWLINQFAKAAPYPVANSLSYEIYRLLPNDSDFSVFKRAGLPGLNFAFIDGLAHYHSAIDNIGNVDRRSLQHHGSYALQIARHFGDLNLDQNRASDQIYFNTPGPILIHYSKTFATILALVGVVLFVFLVSSGLKSRLISIRGILKGLGAFVVSLIVCGGVVALLWLLIKSVHPQYRSIPNGEPYNGDLYFIGFMALTLAMFSTLYLLFSRRINGHDLSFGVLFLWLILTVLTTFLVPGASFLFAWPLLFSLISAAFLLRDEGKKSLFQVRAAVISILAVPVILLMVPMIYLIFVSMTLQVSWVTAALGVLLLGLLIPHLSLLTRSKKWVIPAAAATLALGFIAVASIASGFDQHHPKTDSIFYALNAVSGKAVWASYDQSPDEWTSQFLGPDATRGGLTEYIPIGSTAWLRSEAPAFPIDPPSITLQSETMQDGIRTLHLRLASLRKAAVISATIEPCPGTVVEVNGKQFKTSLDSGWGFRYHGAGQDALDLVLAVNSSDPIKITIVDGTYKLPDAHGKDYQERPRYLIPSPLPLSDSTLVSKSFSF